MDRGVGAEEKDPDRRDAGVVTPQAPSRAARLFPWLVACSNAWAICSRLHSPRWRPTIWMPIGSPAVVNPAGTDIAGLVMKVMYQHDRIQSIYVAIGVPATCVG